ncbi:MAG: RHS repeat-associated core domain-containing protein [Bacteroidales bacterium]
MNAANNTLLHEYSYDAWGRMRNTANLTNYSPGSEPVLFVAGRGFTGHEHLPWFNLINMNGRLYDPLTAQFLSPDNYVQLPDFTQNFNRYSYCLNNLLKYTDPDGEFAWFPIIALAVIFGGYNTAIHAQQGDIDNFWDGLGYFAQGAVAGAAAGAGWSFGIAGITSSSKLQQIRGGILLGGKAVNAISTTASFINNPDNSLKILMGKAYTDENRGFLGGLWLY